MTRLPARARGSRSRVAIALLLVWTTVAGSACKRHVTRDDPQEQGTAPVASVLPALSLTDDTPDLLLTWIDAKGDAHTTVKPAEVPTEGRDQVRVVVTTKEEGTHELFYVANLTVKSADGTYPVTTVPRNEWDSTISKRRAPLLAEANPQNAATDDPAAPGAPGAAAVGDNAGAPHPPSAPATNFTVIVYGASWCGACHQAMAYLKKKHIPAIEKDVEADPRAQAEMEQKLARAGRRGGSIPVIDVKGTILIGFEANALDAAVRAAAGGTAL